MGTDTKPADSVRLSCQACLKEIPVSESNVPEAQEYVAHFCGLECFEQWKRQSSDDPKDDAPKTTPG